MTTQTLVQKKKRRSVHSISFKDEDLNIIKLAAQQEGISFASFLKMATLSYIRESLEYQRLVDSGELKETDKSIAEVISDFKDAIGKTMVSMNENNSERLKRMEWILEQLIYLLLVFNPPLAGTDEEKQAIRAVANKRTKNIMESYKPNK